MLIGRDDVFRVLLGPGYPGHDTHFHFDMAPWRMVQIFEDGRPLEAPQRLLPAAIAAQLRTRRIGRVVHHFDSIDSTNRHAMELARGGAGEGEVVMAEAQTAGRGRLGRSFFSPAGLSFYGSIILRPAVAPARAPQITLVAGLAVAEAVEKHGGMRPGLKWPNDVRLGALKVAGILTEMESEGDRLLQVVCGPGVNLNVPAEAFPPDLRAIATSILAATGWPAVAPCRRVGLHAGPPRHWLWCPRPT
jgi:BirA family biotin operon repressor/biotin-[acetyl-CoA-carboxylase] ligase